MKNKINIQKLLLNPSNRAQIFHKQTKNTKYEGGVQPSTSTLPKSWIQTYFKGYSRLKEVKLPLPNLKNKKIMDIFINRRSTRSFSKKPITLKQLSNILYFSAGIQKITNDMTANRFYPSAGARYPLELYVVSQSVKGLKKGIYHYYLKSHMLEKLVDSVSDKLWMSCFGQDWVKNVPCLIIVTAVFDRTFDKYGDRGYRYILLEAGHVGQNVSLLASSLRFGCCVIGGFADDQINKILDVDGITEGALYIFALGNT